MSAAIVEAAATSAVLVLLVLAAMVPSVLRARRLQHAMPGGMSWRTAWAMSGPNVHDEWSADEETARRRTHHTNRPEGINP